MSHIPGHKDTVELIREFDSGIAAPTLNRTQQLIEGLDVAPTPSVSRTEELTQGVVPSVERPVVQQPQTEPLIRRSVLRGEPTNVRESIGSIGPALAPFGALFEVLGAEAEVFGAPIQDALFGDIQFGPEDQPIFSRIGDAFRGRLDPGQPSQRIDELASAQRLRNADLLAGRMPFIDFVEQSNAQQESRPFLEQVGTGLTAPSNLIPLERVGALGRIGAQVLRRAPIENVAPAVSRNIPAQLARRPTVEEAQRVIPGIQTPSEPSITGRPTAGARQIRQVRNHADRRSPSRRDYSD